MNRQELITAVKVKLEEFSPFEQLEDSGLEIIGTTQLPEDSVRPIHSYIDRLLDESVRDVLTLVPNAMIHADGGNVSALDVDTLRVIDNVGYIPLTDANFVKIYTIRLPEWYRSIHESISPQTDPILYEHQGNPFLRGKVVNPVVAIANGNIELYSAKQDETYYKSDAVSDKVILNYVKATKAEDMQTDLQTLCALRTAIKICEIYNRTESVKLLSDELSQMLEGDIVALSPTKVNSQSK